MRVYITRRLPTFVTRFLDVRTTVSASGAGDGDSPLSVFCGSESHLSPDTYCGRHSYLPPLLRSIISRKMLQLYDVRRRTATHSYPFDSRRLTVRLDMYYS
jgi:hypothetical protein